MIVIFSSKNVKRKFSYFIHTNMHLVSDVAQWIILHSPIALHLINFALLPSAKVYASFSNPSLPLDATNTYIVASFHLSLFHRPSISAYPHITKPSTEQHSASDGDRFSSSLNCISDSVHCNPLTQFSTVSSGFRCHTNCILLMKEVK